MARNTRLNLPLFFLLAILARGAPAQTAQSKTEAATASASKTAQVAPSFDVNSAVEAYFAKMPAARRASPMLISKEGIGFFSGIFFRPSS